MAALGSVDAMLAADAAAPRTARKAVDHLVAAHDFDLGLRLRLLLSEAVSDRVLTHAGSGTAGQLRLQVWSEDGVVHGRISDVPREGQDLTLDMRELAVGMLTAMADAWGTEANHDGTVAIWFELDPSATREVGEYAERFAAALELPRTPV